jgi:acyl-coenzyme A synthetase/AMP-(fatty) acid ligase
MIHPGSFIRKSNLTVWFSVPSTAVFMKRFGTLKPGSYPSLRWSLFCGEPLPTEVAMAWQVAADNSVVENLYGPTEVTIACMLYRWDPDRSPAECVQGLVPIGEPYPGMEAMVADERLRAVTTGGEGELLMSGPQVTPGYWQDQEKTAKTFVCPPGKDQLFYRTGDRVRQTTGGGPIVYLGRMDHQIKIHGHRVELGEIEAVLRRESGVDTAIALGWPRTESGASGIVAFVGDESIDANLLRERVAAHLPDYMVPRKIYLQESLPLNPNGKFDRKALLRLLADLESR